MFSLETINNVTPGDTIYRAALPSFESWGSSATSAALNIAILPSFCYNRSSKTLVNATKKVIINGEIPSNSIPTQKKGIVSQVLSPYETVATTFAKIATLASGSGRKDKAVRHHNVFGAGRIVYGGDPSGDLTVDSFTPTGSTTIGGKAYPLHSSLHTRGGNLIRTGLTGCVLAYKGAYGSYAPTGNGDFALRTSSRGSILWSTAEAVNHKVGRDDDFGLDNGVKAYQHYGFQGNALGALSFSITHETGNCNWSTTVSGTGIATKWSSGYIRRQTISGTATVLRESSDPHFLVLQWTIKSERTDFTIGPTGTTLRETRNQNTYSKIGYAIACHPLGMAPTQSVNALTNTGIAIGGIVRGIWRDLDAAPSSCSQIDAEKDALDKSVRVLTSNWTENAIQAGSAIKSAVSSFAGVSYDLMHSAKYNIPIQFLVKTRNAWNELSDYSTTMKALAWAAKLYLIWRYVYKPALKDIKEVSKAFETFKESSNFSSGITVTKGMVTANSDFAGLSITEKRFSKLVFQSPITRSTSDLYSLGLAPTLANIYDNIPFSFVLDWATNLNVVLDRIDFAVVNRNYHIRTNTAGRKLTAKLECNSHQLLSMIGCQGEMTVTSYSRDILFGISSLDLGLSSRPTHQWLAAGTALALVLHDKPVKALEAESRALCNFATKAFSV